MSAMGIVCACAAGARGLGYQYQAYLPHYRDLGLQLRNKTPKRRVKAKLRADRQMAVGPNDIWAMDFVHDQLATGKKLRVLTVVDTFSRYVPVLDPSTAIAVKMLCKRSSGMPSGRLSQDDPSRSGHRVRIPRSRSLGLCERRHTGLLTPW